MEQQNNKPDKLTDKAFSRLMLTSVLGILVCIMCLCSSTWAWFSDSAPSNSNEIKTADKCLLTVTVTDGEIELADIENGVMLEAEKNYTVTLTLPKDSASGYCLISTDAATYYTDYIVRHEEEDPKTISFTLSVSEDQAVTFTPRWGIYSGDSSVKNNQLLLP